MSVKTANNRLILSPYHAAFYQQVAGSMLSFQELGNRLIRYAEEAKIFRQMSRVLEAGQVLSSIPLKEYQTAGQYYLGWCEYRRDREKARIIFEAVADRSPVSAYRARAMLSLAAIEARKNNYTSELYYVLEALKVSPGFTTRIEALKGIAVIKAKEGGHKQSLKDLEALLPLARYAEPVVYYDCLNSFAVELGEAGRIREAKDVCSLILASPYANVYNEWRETSEEIELKGYQTPRSFVSLTQRAAKPDNIIRLPVQEPATRSGSNYPHSRFHQQGTITRLQDWKKRMVKEPDGDQTDEKNEGMSDRQMVMKIVEIATEDDLPDEALYEMLKAVKKIARAYRDKKD
jgi:tetratricopeptide (TPR) repeat protein